MLWHYDEAEWHNPVRMREWLERGFPARLREASAPAALVVAAGDIVTATDAADVLEVPGELSRVRLPPDDSLRACLERLYGACLVVRLLRNYGSRRRVGERATPWAGLDEANAGRLHEWGALCGELARALEPLTAAIVRWPFFDVRAFEREALARREFIPAAWRGQWAQWFTL